MQTKFYDNQNFTMNHGDVSTFAGSSFCFTIENFTDLDLVHSEQSHHIMTVMVFFDPILLQFRLRPFGGRRHPSQDIFFSSCTLL